MRNSKEKQKKQIFVPSSKYLIAGSEAGRALQKELLYEVLGPVFFGQKEANCEQELDLLFHRRYGIDVQNDFYEGDEHYEEYQEACQAIAEGLSIYGGEISFEANGLADLADHIWQKMETGQPGTFRRINTMLEE